MPTDTAAPVVAPAVTGVIDLLPGLAPGSHLGTVSRTGDGAEVRGGAAAWAYAAIAPFTASGPAAVVVKATGVTGRMSVGVLNLARDDVWNEAELTGAQGQEIRIPLVDAAQAGGVVLRTYQDGAIAPVAHVAQITLEPLAASEPERLAADLLAEGREVGGVTDPISSSYWTRYNVTFHKTFATAEESLAYFEWRNDQYFNYIELMPVAGYDGQVVLDYGCGPGHDLVGFGHYSKPGRLVGADVSPSSLAEAGARLALHGIEAELVTLDLAATRLPFENDTFDHIHSSGVLHHTPDPQFLLEELRRVLKPGGTFNCMIYNYDSVAMHYFAAYQKQIVEGLYAGMSLREAFKHTTDGPDCPISLCYRPQEWITICEAAGFEAAFTGVGIGLGECAMALKRFEACQDERLPPESRRFLRALTFDERGLAMYNGHYAGIDACFSLKSR